MRVAFMLGLALLLALPLVGCCPGSMLNERAQVVTDTRPMDSDGDGVADSNDRCPDTPHGVAVDEYGCPKDRDGDGVADADDKCPDTPRGVSVNRDGCSEAQLAAMAPPPPRRSRAQEQLEEKGEIRLENVYFETGSPKLTEDSRDALDEAGEALEKYPALKIEVGGHSDMRGDAGYNMKLSQKRAESVREYLLAHFKLDGDHLTAKGYGETQPETKERTPEELQQDRRVVLRVLNPGALPHNVEVKH